MDRIRNVEHELFVLLSHVVVAESHDDKAKCVRRLGDGIRRLEGEMGLVMFTFGSRSAPTTKSDECVGVAEAPPTSVGSERAEDSAKVKETQAPSSADPIIGPHLPPPNAGTSVDETPEDCQAMALVSVKPGSSDVLEASSDNASEGVETIQDLSIYLKLKAMTEEPVNHGMVEHKGKLVPAGVKPVLSHVVDSWKDHFSADGPPKVKMSMGKFTCVNGSCISRWRADVSFNYEIDGGWCNSDIVALDGIYLDLGRKTDDGYGQKWVNIYIPCSTWNGFERHLQSCTGWTAQLDGATRDENQRLVSVKAKVLSSNIIQVTLPTEPSTGTTLTFNDRVSVKRLGKLRDVYRNGTCDGVFKGTGYFSVTVNTTEPSMTPPTAYVSKPVNLTLTLASAQVLGASKEVSVATFGNSKTRMYM